MAKNEGVTAANSNEKNAIDELAKLKQEKLAIDANLKKYEAACYKKFAVSNCLKDGKIEAQTALNKVKRREFEIRELQRNYKAESDLSKKEKAANENAANTKDLGATGEPKNITKTEKVAKPATSIKTDAEILAEKNANDKSRADAAKKRLEESNQKQAASQKKAQMRANTNSRSSANTAAYNQKLAQAEAHKAALEKKNLERKKTISAPLPLPDSIPAAKAP